MAHTTNELIVKMEDLYRPAPSLPVNVREVLVAIAPWIALVFGALGVLVGLSAIGLSPLSGILGIVGSVLLLLAFPRLQKRMLSGWTLLFWSEVVSAVSSILSLSLGNIIVGLIIAAIGFYLLFQIKSYYR